MDCDEEWARAFAISGRIRRHLRERGISVEELAEETGIWVEMVRFLLAARVAVGRPQAVTLLTALGLPADDLE